MSPDPARRLARALVPIALLLMTGCQGRRLVTAVDAPARAHTLVLAVESTGYADQVARLGSEDFLTRQRAAERLVEAGELAIPTLGRMGDLMVQDLAGREVSATAPVLRSILGKATDSQVRGHLEAAWPSVRREAAAELGHRGKTSATPALIRRLEDEDVGVRGAAVASLRRLTHRFFGFRAGGTLEARHAAGARWREWWSIQVKRGAVDPVDGEG